MLILQRHYLTEFFKVLAVIAAGLALVFSLLELINKIDDFLPFRPSLMNLMLYVVYIFPRYLLYLLPMAILLCSLFVFSQAIRRHEITAIKAAGGRLKAVLVPFLVAGLILSLFGFVLSEYFVPEFSSKANILKDIITKKDKNFSFKEGTVWLRAKNNSIVKIGLYLPEKKIAKNVSIFSMKDGSLLERIEAESAEWIQKNGSEDVWNLKKLIVYDLQKGSLKRYEELEYPYIESLSVVAEEVVQPADMGIRELMRYTKKLEEAGFKNLTLMVDLNGKLSYPLINFIMALLGISLPMMARTGGGLVTTAIGIFISLVYWFGHTLSLSMGYAGILPPVIATWLVPLIFGAIAVNLFIRIHE